MSPNAIYSKSGKGVQEASGKTSQLSRADRAVLSAIDGKMTVSEVAGKVGRPYDTRFEQLIEQLDRDGFVRQVSAGAPAPAGNKPAAGKPAAGGPAKAPGEDLDFTIAMPAPKAAPKPPPDAPAPPVAPDMAKTQAAAFARAREEAEEKAARERDRIKAETEAKLRAETEARLRSEAEVKAKADAEARVRAEAEAKIKAAREAAVRAAAEAKARAEAEAAAKLEAERAKAREEAERARKEAEEAKRQAEEARRKAEEEARKAREEAEARARAEAEEARRVAEEARRKAEEEARKAREEAERIRREAEEAKRQAEEARRKAEEEARKAREEAERRAREEEARRAREEAERKAREKAEREASEQEEKERKARERAEREQREREEDERKAREKEERKAREKQEREEAERASEAARAQKAEKAKAKAEPASFGDSLLADLDSFSDRQEEERKAKEESSRKEKEEKERQKEKQRQEEEREKQEAAARREREEQARRDKEEAERREKEEEERREREAQERAKLEAAERKRREKEPAAAAAAGRDDDIPLSDDDLDLDDVKKDEAILSKESRRAAREREERERRAKKEAKREATRAKKEEDEEGKNRAWREEPAPTPSFRRPRKWGKPVAVTLFLALIAGVGVLHVMPLSTAEYEKAASQAAGQPVRIGSARLSLYTGVQLNFGNVTIGDTKIASVRAHPQIGSLFGPNKAFSRIEMQGVTLPQAALGGLFGAKVRGENFSVGRINAKNVKLAGPLQLPALDVDLALAEDGSVTSTSVRGPDGLSGKLIPKTGGEMEFDVVAHSFTVPIVPDMSLSGFAMKGTATRDGMKIDSWGGSSLDGAVQGSANVRWAGGNWNIDGVMTVRGINAAVFAPALLSEGKAEGTGRFSFNDADPMSFLGRGRIEGTFSVHKGVLGSFDLSRAIQTGGRQAGGRTPFTGMSGQGVFDKGAVALRNVSFGAGAMNAGASADISAEGTLSGRIVADVRTPSQTLRATLNLGGTVKDPQVKN